MNEQATKESAKYKETTFQANVTGGRAGFKFKFDGFEIDPHITWREVLNNPSTCMFFGAPVSMSRLYDLIFKNAETFQAVHHCFINYYNHFEGGVEASLCLLNSYIAARASVLEKKLKKASCSTTTKKGKSNEKMFTGKVFLTSKSVVGFCEKFDRLCMDSIKSVLTKFHVLLKPIIMTTSMQAFIEEAPAIFGELWDLMCNLRGVKPNQKREGKIT
jgi:hypothetical protein